MKKNVVLVYPRLSIQSISLLQTPFALITIAPYLQKAGYDVKILDIRTVDNYKKELLRLVDNNTLFIGITSMTGSQIVSAIDVSRFIKQFFKNVPLVWGGIHATLMPEQVINNSYVDIVSIGEGESNIVNLARTLEMGLDLKNVSGIYYKENKEIKMTPPKDLFDLNNSLYPSWDIVDVSKYNVMGLQTGRGCPFPCEYCYNIAYNKMKWRSIPLELIFSEIELLVEKYKKRSIFFYDDNFFTSKKRVEDICSFILKKQYDIRWYTTCRSDYFTKYGEDFFRLVKESGCETLAIGVESGSQRILDMLHKQETVEDSINMAYISKKVGIIPECGFMIGIPGETEEDRVKTFDFIDKLIQINPNAYVTSLAIYTPYPGAPLIERIKKEYGFKMPEKLEDWGNFNFHNCNFNWIPRKEKRKLETISYIPRFVFWKEKLRKRYINIWLLPAYYLMTWLAGLRWRHRFFNFSIEYLILNKFLKFKSRL